MYLHIKNVYYWKKLCFNILFFERNLSFVYVFWATLVPRRFLVVNLPTPVSLLFSTSYDSISIFIKNWVGNYSTKFFWHPENRKTLKNPTFGHVKRPSRSLLFLVFTYFIYMTVRCLKINNKIDGQLQATIKLVWSNLRFITFRKIFSIWKKWYFRKL